MPKNVVITPLSGLVDFYDLAGNLDAKIQISDAGDLSIGNTGGIISIGNTASNVYIGDGTNSVDVLFEQNGAIRALTGKTLTLGNSASSVAIQSPLTINSPLLNTTTDGNFEVRQTVSAWTSSTSHPILKWSYNATYDDNLYLASGGNQSTTTQTALVVTELGGVIIGAGPSAPNSSSVLSSEWFRLDNSRFTITRNSAQSLTFENSDTTVNPTIISYSAPANAKNIIFDCKTDASNTAVSAGVLGYEFRVAGTSALSIATDRSSTFSNHVTPTTTNSYTLGSSGALWSNVYATTFTGALTGNASGSAATFTSTTQNSQFNSIGIGVAASSTAGQINAGNIIASGIVTGTGGIKSSDTSFPTYQILLDFGSDTVGVWRKIITATLSAGTQYSTHGFKIKITDPNTNHATQASVNVDEVVYYVACVRSEATVVDTPDLCVVRGPASHVRAVKLATGSYEIQVQPEAQFREYLITIESYATNGAHTIVYSNGSTAGSAGTATYSAAVGAAITWVDKLQSTGTVTGTQLVSNIATGTAPLTVASTTLVTNLNADLLDGLNSATANTASTIVARDASGNFSAGTITAALTGAASSNVLKAGDTMTGALLTNIGGGASSSTKHIDLTNGTGYDLFMLPRAGSGSYNGLTVDGDAFIGFSAGAQDTGGLVIGPWSATSKGLRISSTGATTGTSFNGVTGLSSTAPVVAGTAAVGTGTTVARADHVHPAQTTISGNAATATSATNLYGSAGNYIASSGPASTSYANSIQIREIGLGGIQASAMSAAPRLAFHWSGLIASSIAIEANGRIGIFNNPGTSYEALVCAGLQCNQVSSQALDGDYVIRSYNTSASGASQFYVKHNFAAVEVGNDRGTISFLGNASTATTLATARNINGTSFNGSADITVTAAAGTLTGATLASGVTASSLTSVGTLTSLSTSGAVLLKGAAQIAGSNSSVCIAYSGSTAQFGITLKPDADSTTVVNIMNAAGTSVGSITQTATAVSFNGNATTSTTSTKFLSTRTNYKGVTDDSVAGQLMWKHYGNNHTIFDASNSTSPQGGAINNTNAATAWVATYPTLMGWNGTTTYGVRVDSARVTDALSTASGSAPSYSARAWVNFSATVAGSFPGGTTTASRTAGSTTVTCTCTSAHGLITGNAVYVAFSIGGVALGTYSVTVTGATTFTIQTVATTVLSSVAITFVLGTIRAAGNVSSVADEGVGIYLINFSVAMPDTNYAPIFGWGIGSNPPADTSNDGFANIGEQATTWVRLYFEAANDTSLDRAILTAAIFR